MRKTHSLLRRGLVQGVSNLTLDPRRSQLRTCSNSTKVEIFGLLEENGTRILGDIKI